MTTKNVSNNVILFIAFIMTCVMTACSSSPRDEAEAQIYRELLTELRADQDFMAKAKAEAQSVLKFEVEHAYRTVGRPEVVRRKVVYHTYVMVCFQSGREIKIYSEEGKGQYVETGDTVYFKGNDIVSVHWKQ